MTLPTSVGIYEGGEKGWVRLGAVHLVDGEVEIDESVRDIVEGFYVPDLNDGARRRLSPRDGEVFLEMLARTLRGSVLRAAVEPTSGRP